MKSFKTFSLLQNKIYFCFVIVILCLAQASPWHPDISHRPRTLYLLEDLESIRDRLSNNSDNIIGKKSKYNPCKYIGKCEVCQLEQAVDTHHIFPRSFHFNLCYYRENLIRITPDEHYVKAHPNRNTQIVDKPFQVELLKAKLNSIKTSLDAGEDFYDLKLFIDMLNKGFKIDLPDDLNIDDLKNFLNSR